MQKRVTKSRWSIVIAALLPQMASAGSIFPTLPQLLDKEWESHKILRATRLTDAMNPNTSFDYTARHRALKGFLHSNGVHPLFQVVERPSDQDQIRAGFGLSGIPKLTVRNYTLRVGKYEVCNVNLRTVEGPSGSLHALGVAPKVSAVYSFTDDAWHSQQEAEEVAVKHLAAAGISVASSIVTLASMCLYPQSEELVPAWELVIRSGYMPYRLFVSSSEVLEGDVMGFDATAKVRAYENNPTDAKLVDFDVNVIGDGFLTNEYFISDSAETSIPRQQSTANIFTQSPGNKYFAEQSTFAHVNRHFDFASSMGYVWKGPKPLTVRTHVTLSGGDRDNAVYSPFDGRFGPFILIADGQDKFQNLPFDSDVVSHEFGHHVIFARLTSTSGESLVIHEGMADAIAFMRSPDGCLGESICPATSKSCQIPGKCLRSGTTTMKYSDAAYNASAPHFKGQVVSGLFMDLYKSGKIPGTDMGKLAIGTVDFLPSKADMNALIMAMLDADFSLFGQRYQSAIIDAAARRGLGVDTLGVNLGLVDGIRPPSDDGTTKSKSGGGGFLGLCSIGSAAMSPGSSAIVAILLLLPILAHLANSRSRTPVPARSKPNRKKS